MKRFLHQNAALPLGRQVGKKIALFGLVFFFAVTSIPFANAAPRKGYEAKVVTAPIETIIMAPGETKTISLTYKNSGKTAWKRKGAGYVSFYTADKNYRKSVFEAKNWFDATHAALLKETTVKPGASGNFKLVLKAPEKVGTYKEAFGMVAEDITWIPGGELKLVIEVQKPGTVAKAKPASAPSVKLVSDTSAPTLSAFLLLRSTKLVTAEGNEQIVYKVGMKNTGTTPWMKREVRSSDALAIASVGALPTTQIALNTSGVVEPGALDFLSFVFKAPPTKGMYTIKYQFAANDVVLSDAEILIPVEVTSDAEDVLNSPVLDATILQNMIPEPMLRIGVLIVDEETNNEVKISCNTDWKLVDGNGALLAEQAANQSIQSLLF